MLMLEWPGHCSSCKERIQDWSDVGFYHGRWIHKACWSASLASPNLTIDALPQLHSPVDRSKQLEWPMLFFVLLFHFGLGGAVAGWIMLTQGFNDQVAAVILTIGIVAPLIGIAGIAVNIVGRRRIELIRQVLETNGGWKPVP